MQTYTYIHTQNKTKNKKMKRNTIVKATEILNVIIIKMIKALLRFRNS